MNDNMPEGTHFYAASVALWATTNETRNLRELFRLMDKEGFGYNLFLVPVAHDTDYEIKMYQPQVEGTQWLGYFETEKGKKK